MTRFVRYQLPAIVWMALIFVLSSLPASAFPNIQIWNADKFVHIGLFFVLCWFVHRALWFQSKSLLLKYRSVGLAFLFVALYGVLDEFHQGFVPGRTQDVYDALADVIGGALFTLVFLVSVMIQRSDSQR